MPPTPFLYMHIIYKYLFTVPFSFYPWSSLQFPSRTRVVLLAVLSCSFAHSMCIFFMRTRIYAWCYVPSLTYLFFVRFFCSSCTCSCLHFIYSFRFGDPHVSNLFAEFVWLEAVLSLGWSTSVPARAEASALVLLFGHRLCTAFCELAVSIFFAAFPLAVSCEPFIEEARNMAFQRVSKRWWT